ncbi:helix-turn-helix domain-containing protein [Nocardia sp. NPDC050793]|uniref:PucR family transcriptional regulator n=1 Tax=Nocardia sp. NPDC050793 TaxID=3155159 RepID=UPI0033C59C0D
MSAVQPRLSVDAPIINRLVPRLADLMTELLDAGIAAIPEAEGLPDGHFTDEVIPAIVAGAALFLEALDEGRACTPEEVAELMVPVVQRHAEDRIPLRVLILALFGSVRRLWAEAGSLAEPDDLPDLLAFSDLLLDLLANVAVSITETHSDVEQSIYGSEREARRLLCAALLRGVETAELAARADITLADRYDILAIQVVPFNQAGPMVDAVVARRRIRLVQQALDALAGTTALNTFDGTTGIALLPTAAAPSADAPYTELGAALATRLGDSVVVIDAGSVPRSELAAAASEAAELNDLAGALDLPTGTYVLDDLMLEYQLTRPGRSRDRLAQRIVPLEPYPHLLEALVAHIRHGSDRKAAAAEVHLHPNSFSYRLRRIATLTGFDPSDPGESRLLSAALMVYRLYPPAASANIDSN